MNGFVPTLELTGLLGSRQAAGCNVLVAMVCNLVASLVDGATRFGIKIDGESRNEPGGLDVVARKQRQQSLRTHQAKFSSRDRRRTGLSVCKPAGDGIEVESQRDLMLPSCHWSVTGVSLFCSKQLVWVVEMFVPFFNPLLSKHHLQPMAHSLRMVRKVPNPVNHPVEKHDIHGR